MEFKSGIYLREKSPVLVEVGNNYVDVKYMEWNENKEMWVFRQQDRFTHVLFVDLNKPPCQVLFYYGNKWEYGRTKEGLKGGKNVPKQQKKLRDFLKSKLKVREMDLP